MPISVGIEFVILFLSVGIIGEKKLDAYRTNKFLKKHNSKTEKSASRLQKLRLVSSVNKKTSVGIEPVSSFQAVKMIWEKVNSWKELEAKKESVLLQSIIVE